MSVVKEVVLTSVLTWLPVGQPALSQAVPLRLGPVAPACQFDTAAVRDTASFTLYVTPPGNTAGGANVSESYAPFVHAVASAFEPPAQVTLATWPGTFYSMPADQPTGGKDLACGIGPLTGTVRLGFKNGHVKSVAWDVLPDSREVTQALQTAVRRADSLGYFLGSNSPPGSPKGTVRLGLTMTAATAPDHGWPVLRVRMPYIRIQVPAGVRHQPAPVYPPAALKHGVEGDVALQYVIDEDGRVQAASIRVLEANYQDFVDAAVETIVASEYTPARVGECPVKSVVQQWIRFRAR